MSWLFSRELVVAYLGENFSDGEQSALSNGNHTQQAYCAPDKMTKFSKLSRFGMTFKPLMESRGEELLMLYLEDFHVKTSPQQEKEQELTVSDLECGGKWQGSFTKYDQDMRSWKTHQCSLLGGLDEFLETWPQWGLMRDGECWEQQTLEQTIRGTESGFSPNGVDSFHTPNTTGLDGGSNSRRALRKKLATPVARMWKDNGKSPSELNRNSETLAMQAGGNLNPTWVEWLMGWSLGWTDLNPLETDKYHCVQQQHGES